MIGKVPKPRAGLIPGPAKSPRGQQKNTRGVEKERRVSKSVPLIPLGGKNSKQQLGEIEINAHVGG